MDLLILIFEKLKIQDNKSKMAAPTDGSQFDIPEPVLTGHNGWVNQAATSPEPKCSAQDVIATPAIPKRKKVTRVLEVRSPTDTFSPVSQRISGRRLHRKADVE